MRQISFSSDTIERHISGMSEDVRPGDKLTIASAMFCFHVDEYTDVTSCAQLLVFVRYIHSGDHKEEFLFCEEQQTTSADALEKIKTFFDWAELQWKCVCGI